MIVIVGAGPTGLCCAATLKARGLRTIVLEKGCVADSIHRFPTSMRFFTTADGLEIGALPMNAKAYPTRNDALHYYRTVMRHFDLSVSQQERVLSISGNDESFRVNSAKRSYAARKVIIASGYCHRPRYLNVEGEDLPKVSHYFKESRPYADRKVAVVGGRNSAGAAALELFHAGARVTVIHRQPSFTSSMKPWLRSELEQRVATGEIQALFSSCVRAICGQSLLLDSPAGIRELSNDFVFALTGYEPDMDFLTSAGISVDASNGRPALNPETMETNRPGLYLAGVIVAGTNTHEMNIGHGRDHAKKIADAIPLHH